MDDWADDLKWNAFAYAAVGGAALTTLVGLWLFVPALRRRWLPMQRLRPGRWTGHDVFLAFCVGFGFPLFIVEGLIQVGFFAPLIGLPPAEDAERSARAVFLMRCVAISSPIALAMILGILFTVIFVRSGARPHHYGLSWGRWPANIALGIAAFVVCKPIIVGIYAVAVPIFPATDDSFKAYGELHPAAWEWALLAFQTTVMAPLVEEILCRGLLQGWLRRASLTGHVIFLSMSLFATMLFHNGDLIAIAFILGLAAIYAFGLYRLARKFDLTEAEIPAWRPLPGEPSLGLSETERTDMRRLQRQSDEERLARWTDANARMAILGSALIWAAIHAPWPKPLPLFPMGLVLGWLAYRTQSLIGPITFHALFNLATFIAFYGSVAY